MSNSCTVNYSNPVKQDVNGYTDELAEEFEKALERFAEILKESEERVEELGNIDISDVPDMVKKITDFYSAIFPSRVSNEVINELQIRYPNGGTAVDVYLALADIVDRHIRANDLSLTRRLDLSEQVASLIHLPFDKIESGEHELKK